MIGRVVKIVGIIIASLLGLTLAASVGLFIALERGWLNGPIERMASRQLGREVNLSGGIDVDLGKTLAFELGPVRVANPDWAPTPTMAQIGRARVAVSLPALLRGEVVLPEIVIDQPEAGLVRLADGRANWQFDMPAASPEAGATGRAAIDPADRAP